MTLLTAPGASAIAVVRLAGPLTLPFLRQHFSRNVRDGAAVHGRLMDGERELDDPLILWNAAAQQADICTHGGRWVVHSVMELAQREGFAPIAAGTDGLPDIAVDAENAIERAILKALPAARTQEAIQTLLNQREAWESLGTATCRERPEVALDRSLFWLLHTPRVAIIGIPNAGKSTLANALFGRDRSIVADQPGTTRDYVEEFANLSGLPVRLVDTPGLRTSDDPIEMAAIDISTEQLATTDLLLLLIDPTQPSATQQQLLDRYPHAMRVVGKSDTAANPIPPATDQTLRISAATGEGLAALEQAIHTHFGCTELPHRRPCLWTTAQQQLWQAGAWPFDW